MPPLAEDAELVRDLARSGEARRIRVSRGVSLHELAKTVGVSSPTTVMYWERAERTPRPETASRYLDALHELAEAAEMDSAIAEVVQLLSAPRGEGE